MAEATIIFSVRADTGVISVDELENLCIEIGKPNAKPFIVVYWYRPPNFPTGLFSPSENLTTWYYIKMPIWPQPITITLSVS